MPPHQIQTDYHNLLDSVAIFERADKAKTTLKARGSELTHSKIVKRLKETSNKASAQERQTKLEHFSTTLQKTGLSKQVKAEIIEETGYTSNAVYLNKLTLLG